MKKFGLIILLSVPIACSDDGNEMGEPEIIAEAVLHKLNQVADKEYKVMEDEIGTATFYQAGDVVTLEIMLTGMIPNTFKAVHIHQGTPEVPGRHWNGGKFYKQCSALSMGKDWAKPFMGDVGNVPIDEEGNGFLTLRTNLWKLNSGDRQDLLDLPIIIHERPQDFAEECDPLHNHLHDHRNPKIGGGTISLKTDISRNLQTIVSADQMPDFLICK